MLKISTGIIYHTRSNQLKILLKELKMKSYNKILTLFWIVKFKNFPGDVQILHRKSEMLESRLLTYLSFVFNVALLSQTPTGYMLKTTELLNLTLFCFVLFPLKPIGCDQCLSIIHFCISFLRLLNKKLVKTAFASPTFCTV